jgi:hypothetical protein
VRDARRAGGASGTCDARGTSECGRRADRKDGHDGKGQQNQTGLEAASHGSFTILLLNEDEAVFYMGAGQCQD